MWHWRCSLAGQFGPAHLIPTSEFGLLVAIFCKRANHAQPCPPAPFSSWVSPLPPGGSKRFSVTSRGDSDVGEPAQHGNRRTQSMPLS
jgi:hypothetical protein